MAEKALSELTATFVKPLAVEDTEMSEQDIAAFDGVAKKNLHTIFACVPDNIARTPHINYIYLSQPATLISTVPADLQLAWYCDNFSDMIEDDFTAMKDNQDMAVTRGIWYYGLDTVHSFSRYYHCVRYNLVVMALLMADGFPRRYCAPDVDRFILAYIDAWLSALVDTGQLETQSFKAQEDFIRLWEVSGLDLLPFTQSQKKKAGELTAELRKVSLPPSLSEKVGYTPEQIVTMRRQGMITDEEFKKFGPSLVLEYIVTLDTFAKEDRAERSSIKDIREEKMARRLAERQAQNGKDPLRYVPWGSTLLEALLGAVDPDLPAPQAVRKKQYKNPPLPQGDPWIDIDEWFELMRSGLKWIKEEQEDVCAALENASLGD